MAWDSFSDMPWLGHIEPAGAPALRGAEAGAAIASSWQRSRALNIQEKENATRAAEFQQTMPLQQARADYEKAHTAQMNLAVQTEVENKNKAVEADALAPTAHRLISTAVGVGQAKGLNSPEYQDAEDNWNSFLADNAHLSSTPAFQNLLGALDKYKMGRMQQDAKMQELQMQIYAGRFESRRTDPFDTSLRLRELDDQAEAARLTGNDALYKSLHTQAQDIRLSTQHYGGLEMEATRAANRASEIQQRAAVAHEYGVTEQQFVARETAKQLGMMEYDKEWMHKSAEEKTRGAVQTLKRIYQDELSRSAPSAAKPAAPVAGAVTIRSKADPSKVFQYHGDPADIPKDQYDIVK